jgi:alkanesulfonate monooxygenase SsuD/methylene tetrahydromethanopterin reductase-like flavin-dependent oxidoreductase (luciferase family)
MTSCFLGDNRADAVERVGRFLAARGDDTDPEAMLGERRQRWLAGSVDDVAERVDELRELGVTRVFLQHLNHDDDEMVALIGERLLPALTTRQITHPDARARGVNHLR